MLRYEFIKQHSLNLYHAIKGAKIKIYLKLDLLGFCKGTVLKARLTDKTTNTKDGVLLRTVLVQALKQLHIKRFKHFRPIFE